MIEELVEKIDNAVRDYRRLMLDELPEMFWKSPGLCCTKKIKESLGYRKLSVRWVPKQLTEQHKLNRVQSSKEVLEHYELEGDDFLHRIVTGYKT